MLYLLNTIYPFSIDLVSVVGQHVLVSHWFVTDFIKRSDQRNRIPL